MSSSNKLRHRCSFPYLLLSCLNFSLFILSLTSLAPIILLKNPPTSLGYAFLMVSTISLLSSFIGFYSNLTHFCFITHISLLLASSIAQLLSVLALFTRENSALIALKSPRDPREAKVLVRLECGIYVSMLLMQFGVLMVTCGVHCCWVRDFEAIEAQREATERRRSRRVAKVQEESMGNGVKIGGEIKGKELDEKMKSKYGVWVKNDFEG